MRRFEELFGFAPQATARAPGRVNLLGEHTDYNDGFVLPTAIARYTDVEIGLSRDGRHSFHSADLEQSVAYAPGEEPPEGFARYIHGCIEVLRERGHSFGPLAIWVHSSVPIGRGLSSSAALEVAVLRALRSLGSLPLDDLELARLAQQAEIRFAHVQCGLMDQMASSLADCEHMLFIDMRTLEHRLVPLPEGAEIVILDSGVARTLAASGYNERREQCTQAAQLLGVQALRDVSDPAQANRLPPPLDRRARHVINENNRVLQALTGVDAREFGRLMSASHASLRDDYEVSVAALDALAESLQAHPAVFGAKLTGAGFGGACVALVETGRAAQVKSEVLARVSRKHPGVAALL